MPAPLHALSVHRRASHARARWRWLLSLLRIVSGAAVSWRVISCVRDKTLLQLPAWPQKGFVARRKLVWGISLIEGTYLIRGKPGVRRCGVAAITGGEHRWHWPLHPAQGTGKAAPVEHQC